MYVHLRHLVETLDGVGPKGFCLHFCVQDFNQWLSHSLCIGIVDIIVRTSDYLIQDFNLDSRIVTIATWLRVLLLWYAAGMGCSYLMLENDGRFWERTIWICIYIYICRRSMFVPCILSYLCKTSTFESIKNTIDDVTSILTHEGSKIICSRKHVHATNYLDVWTYEAGRIPHLSKLHPWRLPQPPWMPGSTAPAWLKRVVLVMPWWLSTRRWSWECKHQRFTRHWHNAAWSLKV